MRRKVVLSASQVVLQRRADGLRSEEMLRKSSYTYSAIFNTSQQRLACKVMRCAARASMRAQHSPSWRFGILVSWTLKPMHGTSRRARIRSIKVRATECLSPPMVLTNSVLRLCGLELEQGRGLSMRRLRGGTRAGGGEVRRSSWKSPKNHLRRAHTSHFLDSS